MKFLGLASSWLAMTGMPTVRSAQRPEPGAGTIGKKDGDERYWALRESSTSAAAPVCLPAGGYAFTRQNCDPNRCCEPVRHRGARRGADGIRRSRFIIAAFPNPLADDHRIFSAGAARVAAGRGATGRRTERYGRQTRRCSGRRCGPDPDPGYRSTNSTRRSRRSAWPIARDR